MPGLQNWSDLERRILTSKTVKAKLEGLGASISQSAAVHSPVRTGALKANWYKGVRTGANPSVGYETWVLNLGDRMYYAKYQEFGTRYFVGRKMLQTALLEHGIRWDKAPNSPPPTGGKSKRSKRRQRA